MDAPDPYGMNVSDDEREHVIAQLREALEAGRLSPAEFERRSGAAYAAASYGDLNRVLDDLPGSSPARTSEPYRYDPYGMQYPTAPPPMPVPMPYGVYPPGRPPENGFGVAGLVLGLVGVALIVVRFPMGFIF